MNNKVLDDLWKQMNSSMNMFVWTQEQAEKFINTLMEQAKVNRDDASAFVNQLWDLNKQNQQQFQNMIQESINTAFSNWKVATQTQFEELAKKLDEVAKKLDTK